MLVVLITSFIVQILYCHGAISDKVPSSGGLLHPEHSLASPPVREVTPSPRADQCPVGSAIQPCTCYEYPDGGVAIDCGQVMNEEELTNVFQAHFPNPDIYQLMIGGSAEAPVPIGVLTGSTFGDVSFQIITISYTDIHTVQPDTFKNSYDTLENYKLSYSQISYFDFEEIEKFSKLKYLDFSYNLFPNLPEISSTSLIRLTFSGNTVMEINDGSFAGTPNLMDIALAETGLRNIAPGTLDSVPQIGYLSLIGNNISELVAGSLVAPDNALQLLRLTGNQLTTVETSAIDGLVDSAQVDFAGCNLQELPEVVWRPVFDQLTDQDAVINLLVNPLKCDCDLSWLVSSAAYMSHLRRLDSVVTSCSDGSSLEDLDISSCP